MREGIEGVKRFVVSGTETGSKGTGNAAKGRNGPKTQGTMSVRGKKINVTHVVYF